MNFLALIRKQWNYTSCFTVRCLFRAVKMSGRNGVLYWKDYLVLLHDRALTAQTYIFQKLLHFSAVRDHLPESCCCISWTYQCPFVRSPLLAALPTPLSVPEATFSCISPTHRPVSVLWMEVTPGTFPTLPAQSRGHLAPAAPPPLVILNVFPYASPFISQFPKFSSLTFLTVEKNIQ